MREREQPSSENGNERQVGEATGSLVKYRTIQFYFRLFVFLQSKLLFESLEIIILLYFSSQWTVVCRYSIVSHSPMIFVTHL